MSQVTLSGTLTVAPATVVDGTFPAATTTTPLALNPTQKQANVDTGIQSRNLNSPSSYATLSGVGATDTVTQGNFLYLRTKVPMLVQLVVNNPAGGTVTVTGIPINGLLILEFDATRYLVGLSVQGSGYVEWFVSGTQ